MKEKTIYDLELFEEFHIESDDLFITIMRVPGGWVKTTQDRGEVSICETFIPYSTEFKNNEPLEMD